MFRATARPASVVAPGCFTTRGPRASSTTTWWMCLRWAPNLTLTPPPGPCSNPLAGQSQYANIFPSVFSQHRVEPVGLHPWQQIVYRRAATVPAVFEHSLQRSVRKLQLQLAAAHRSEAALSRDLSA